MNNKTADLHIHSRFSDSDLSGKQIFTNAEINGLSCISVTDHDTFKFYTTEDYKSYSRKYSVEIIKGIELSVEFNNQEVHILGYFSDKEVEPEFLAELKNIETQRRTRVFAMADRLSVLGIDIDTEEFKKLASNHSLSRLHLGSFLKDKGIVKNLKEAFNKYIGPGRPAYISRRYLDIKQAISLCKKSEGLVFLAHPVTIKNQDSIKDIIAAGIDGLEVFYPMHRKNMVTGYMDLAKKHNLLISGGSDAHGTYKDYAYIGKTTLAYTYVEKIKERLSENSKFSHPESIK